MAVPVAAAAAAKLAAKAAAKRAAKQAAVKAASNAVAKARGQQQGAGGGVVAWVLGGLAAAVVTALLFIIAIGTSLVASVSSVGGVFAGGGVAACETAAASAVSDEALADIPPIALQAYQQAATAVPNLDWSWIAGIGKVESNHGRFAGSEIQSDGQVVPPIMGPVLDGSGAGGNWTPVWDTDDGVLDGNTTYDRAVGPVQFIPQTWYAYAQDGNGDGEKDPQNIWDSTRTTAVYLASRGAPADMHAAVLGYNNSETYYQEVLHWKTLYSAPSTSTPGGPDIDPVDIAPGAWTHPLPAGSFVISSQFGMRVHPITGELKLHDGTDFAAPTGTPIFAASSGVVRGAYWHPSGGNITEILHANGIATKYLHQNSRSVRVGDTVSSGQQIGTVGNTGASTGAHLHFVVAMPGATMTIGTGPSVDPVPFLTSVGVDPTAGGEGGGGIYNPIIGTPIEGCPSVIGGGFGVDPSSEQVEAAMAFAFEQVGEPYVLGGTGPDVWDCSGLVMRSWEAAGFATPRVSGDQFRWAGAKQVPAGSEQRGDWIFFETNGTPLSPGHIGMVWDPAAKLMIHAPRPGKTVEIVSYNTPYYNDEFLGFRRVIGSELEEEPPVAAP